LADEPTPPPDETPGATPPVTIEEEMRRSFLDYSMSVIVSRALPDVRDGLKPVHRRILYSMHENGYSHDKPHRKSARVVGDVIGKYHPHGDVAIYDAMVRMAQPFSMGAVLIDGQGNFGSLDGDPPAAMRYTEARLSKLAAFLLADIDQDTVAFNPNYDETDEEPAVLPAAFPNLLVNGAGGIAVGMATNIPTHNFTEVIDATLAVLDDPEVTLDQLMQIMPGPDFPTGGIILGRAGIRAAFTTGRGSVVVRARASIEEWKNNRQAIVVTEVPYQVNKARVLEKLADLVRAKEIEGISDLRDESDRSGVRMVIEVKRDANAEVVLNQLWRRTELQTTFPVNTLALLAGRPVQMGLKMMLEAFIVFRDEVILRRSRFQLNKARDRAHALVGLAIASDNIDAVIAMIRASRDAAEARVALMGRDWPAENIAPLLALIDAEGNQIGADNTVRLTEAQARAILDLRLQRLTALERDAIAKELGELGDRIRELLELVGSRPRRAALMRAELVELREKFPQPRRTAIEESDGEVEDESLIEQADMVVTLTQGGLIKRVALAAFRAQRRGGRGRSGMATRDDDVVTRIFVANTHQWVLFFSSRGMAYRMKVWRLPEAEPQARGRSLKGFVPIADDETITAVLALPQDEALWPSLYLLFATASGNVRRNRLSDFDSVRQNGLIAMKLDDGDALIGVVTCREGDDILLGSRKGRVLRFQITDDALRVFAGRSSDGVRGIKLASDDRLIAATVLRHVEATPAERAAYLKVAPWKGADDTEEVAPEAAPDETTETVTLRPERVAELAATEEFILTVTEGGMGKRSSAYDYRVTGRGGQGIENLGAGQVATVAAVFPVTGDDQVVLVTDGGQLIRCPVGGVRITGRRSRGVILFRAREAERVVSVFPVLGDEAGDEAGDDTSEDSGPTT
jgi:DNA gyrase subunit A